MFPSAEEATEIQLVLGALVGNQVVPEFVEVQIKPEYGPDTATNLFPSAEEATAIQLVLGAVVTLPPLGDTLALLGSGDAVSVFRQMDWLKRFRIVYWGDMDTHGFEALSLLRKHYAHTASVMMDVETYERFCQFAKKAAPYFSDVELVLSDTERKLFKTLDKEGKLLEQERITLIYAKRKLQAALHS